MTILITGGSGFVGLNVAEALLGRGRDVVLLADAPPPEAAAATLGRLPGSLTAVVGDVRTGTDVARIFARHRPRQVVHAAALTPGPRQERAAARATMEVNLLGTLAVLQAAHDHGVARVVLVSSGAVYGQAAFEVEAIAETTPPAPGALYAISKLAAEQAGLRLGELLDLEVVACRLGTVFGPWERATGVRETLSPIFQVMHLARQATPVVLPREGRRDWVYARDVAAAIVAVLAAPAPAAKVYNVSSGVEWTVAAWCARLASALPQFSYRIADATAEANVGLWSDRDRAPLAIDRLAEEIGFRPTFGLAAAFDDYLDWLRRHPVSVGGFLD